MNNRDLAEEVVHHVVRSINGQFLPEWYFELDYRELVIEVENIIESSEVASGSET